MRGITFFIGNGFDINVGLNTKYSEFYEYYLKKNPQDMLAKEIGANYEYWANLEEGLGHYTAKVPNSKIDQFFKSEDLMEESLADYLELQMDRIQISSGEEKEIAKRMKKSLLKFYEELPKSQEEYIKNLIYKTRDSIKYSFIVFNYTNSFDKCLQLLKQEYSENIDSHKADNRCVYQISAGNIIHINGTVNEEMILGVNDVSQIDNQEIIKNSLFCQFLIKKETNKRFG